MRSKRIQSNKVGRVVAEISLSVLGLLALLLVYPILPGEAGALEPGQSEFRAATDTVIHVQSSISLALDHRVDMDIIPKSGGTINTVSSQLAVATNNSTGYGIYLNTVNGESTLKLIGGEETINPLSSGATPTDEGWTEMNTWGYRLMQDGISGEDVPYRAVPATTAQVKNVATLDDISARDTFELSFGVAVDTTIPAGSYANSVLVSVVANPREVQSFGEIRYMQEMTPAICQSMKDLPEDKRTGVLIDQRDGKGYWVAYLADGNCWMTQNLALDLDEDTVLTPADTDIENDWTIPITTETEVPAADSSSSQTNFRSWNLGNYVLATPQRGTVCSNGTGSDGHNSVAPGQSLSRCTNLQLIDSSWVYKPMENGVWDSYAGLVAANKTNKTYDSHYLIGNFYQWNAATAGTGGTIVSQNAKSSICPKGWRLPTSGSRTAEFAKLLSAYGYPAATSDVFAVTSSATRIDGAPIYMVRGGIVNLNSGGIRSMGAYGHLRSSTAFTSNTNAYDLMIYGANIQMLWNDARYNGIQIRCIAK